MNFTKTINLDFSVPYVDATVTLEEEESLGGPMACQACAAAAAAELAFLTMCSRCQDDAADCSTCAPPAAVIGEAPTREETPGDLTQGWYIADRDMAAEMWDFR